MNFLRGIGLLLLLASGEAHSGGWGQWEEARKLYDSQEYDRALEHLKEKSESSAEYYFNLGTLYYRTNQPGLALAHFLKAERLAPLQADIQHNLGLTQRIAAAKYGASRLDPATTPLQTLTDRVTWGQLLTLVGAMLAFCALGFALVFRKAGSLRAALTFSAGWVSLAGVSLAGIALGAKTWGDATPPVVLLRSEVIRSGPAEHYLGIGALEAGFKVRATGRNAHGTQGRWLQVRFGGDEVGWIPQESVLLL
ncbi:MAG: tetratricopeptide repeat protein [Bdellovibrionales bacterium]|nr:tetratricopeptide repeat protein [Bdellovibrionales bacterium]